MRPISYIIILSALVLFAGCKNWDVNPEISASGWLTKIENGDHQVIGENTYKNGLLKDSWYHTDYFMTGKNEEYTYTFNDNNRLIKKEGFQPGNMIMSSMTGAMDKNVTVTYEYDSNDRISKIKTSYDYPEMEEINYETQVRFEYPKANTVISYFYYVDELANSVTPKTRYTLNKNGNIEKKEVVYETDLGEQINTVEECTYDTYSAPYDFEPGIHSGNNILTKTITSYNYDEKGNQSVGYVSEYTYEYEYNSNGYPSKVTETWPNEIQNIKYYTYY